MNDILKISRIVCGWIVIMTSILACIIVSSESSFFRFGPSDDLEVLGVVINTKSRYALVVSYSVVNTIIRNLNHNIINPWIILNVQNTEIERDSINQPMAYEVSICSTLYTWFDYLIYISLLLAQFDLFLIETFTDVIGTVILTRWYLQTTHPESVYKQLV